MSRLRGTPVIVGLCAALMVSSAWAEGSPFVGRWHWNRAQSTLPPGEPAPNDLISEISRADGTYVTWSVTIVTPDGQPHVVTFDARANGIVRGEGREDAGPPDGHEIWEGWSAPETRRGEAQRSVLDGWGRPEV